MSRKQSPRLVLVGGGHSHAQILEGLIDEPLAGMEVHVVVDHAVAVYSGMVPGLVAGRYRRRDVEIDIAELARRAGLRLHLEPMAGIDPAARRVLLADSEPLAYDLASLNLGSSVAGLDLPGVRLHSLSTRPMQSLIEGVEGALERARDLDRPFRLVIVGGGAGGVELAFCSEARLGRVSRTHTTLVTDSDGILQEASGRFAAKVLREAERRGIRIETGRRAVEVEEGRVRLDDGAALDHDLVIWAAGAVGPQVLRDSGLPVDSGGFVLTEETLLVEGRDDLFAVGDCATSLAHPTTPKAGVYAVRQGPVLLRNLRRWHEGRELERYRPQEDFLRLLNLGDGRAVGGKWGVAAAGRWVMWLKDRIDRRFVERFRE